jgi:hypothetical protein
LFCRVEKVYSQSQGMPPHRCRIGCNRVGAVGWGEQSDRDTGNNHAGTKETITLRRKAREIAEGSAKNVGWGGGHIDGCGVKLKDTGEVVEGDDHAETQRMARKAQVSGIRYQ